MQRQGWQWQMFDIFPKLIRTKSLRDAQDGVNRSSRRRLNRCLTTMDLTSLGVGSCVGTGMYLVSGLVARKLAGPGVIISYLIAAIASVFSGVCYAEFGVRVPFTSGSAYSYTYVTVGELIGFIIGWNMILEYMIGTSACASALSSCIDALLLPPVTGGDMVTSEAARVATKQVDFLAFGITILMMILLVAGVRKSLMFNNVLNSVNFCAWMFIMGAGSFYIDFKNWYEHEGFLPYGWPGVFVGAATCFYAFIGFDIIATTGEEANCPQRSIPSAIILSLAIILTAYVSSSFMLTLIVPYDEIDTNSAIVQMFDYVHAPVCKMIVGIGALAGLTVSMFGSMFPMPRIIYAMAQDGLIFKELGIVYERTGTPALATVVGGLCAAVIALFVKLEVLVEMMSIGTLLAYTMVSSCVLILRYQPHCTNIMELLPQSLRTPVGEMAIQETRFSGFHGELSRTNPVLGCSNPVMIRRVTRSSPDSDDTMAGEDSEGFGQEDTSYLIQDENNYYVGAASSAPQSTWARFQAAWSRWLQEHAYLCPSILPWTDCGPATEASGLFVCKATGVMYLLIIVFDLFAAYGSPGYCVITNWVMAILFVAIIAILLIISRKPQNRSHLLYATPALPFVPAIAVTVNIYLILNLSPLTLLRFVAWMSLGMVIYFKYGINNSLLENALPTPTPTPPPVEPSVLHRTTLPPHPAPSPRNTDKSIFEGDSESGQYAYGSDPLLRWHEGGATIPTTSYTQIEQRFNMVTERATSHARPVPSRPPWAAPDYDSWND